MDLPLISTGVFLDDVDTITYGYFVATPEGWDPAPARSGPTVALPTRPGAFAGGASVDGVRRVVLRGTLIGVDPADARLKLDRLWGALAKPSVRLRVADPRPAVSPLPARELVVRLAETSVPPADRGHLVRAAFPLDVTLEALQPFKTDVTETVLALSGTPVACPLGTAPVRPRIELTGGATLTYRSAAGVVLATLAVSGSGTIVVDGATQTVVDGAGASLIATAIADDADFFALDPADGSYPLAQWPTVSSTNGGTLRYRRAWR